MTDIQLLNRIAPWDWPDNSSEVLLEVLRDKDAAKDERLLAAELAGDFVVINDDLIEALLDILADNSETDELRARAVISFGPALEQIELEGFDDIDNFDNFAVTEPTYKRLQKKLKKLYFDAAVPQIVRRRILEASVRDPQPWHENVIRANWKSGEKDWMITAVFCMIFVQGFKKEILQALENKDAEIKYEAVRAVENWSIEEAAPYLAEILEDNSSDRDLLFAAIDAGGFVDNSRVRTAMGRLLDSSDDDDIIDALHESLSMSSMLREDFYDEDDW